MESMDDCYCYLDAYVSLLSDSHCCSPLPHTTSPSQLMGFADHQPQPSPLNNHWIPNYSSTHAPPPPPPPPQPHAGNNNTTRAGEPIIINNREKKIAAGAGAAAKVSFKTKSQIDVLDDGFKWRKYGKKMVKNSPNPRNYYRCSVEGCAVKKRVERDNDDSRYVLTTYEGIHTHLPSAP